jgi:phosphatidylinositol alpha-1,6-mannosyltransferase
MERKLRRILIPTFEYLPQVGGIAVYISQQLVQLESLNCKVLVIEKSLKRLKLYLKLYKEIASNDCVFVHHIFPIGFAVYLISFFKKIDFYIFFHGMDYDQLMRSGKRKFLTRLILKKATGVFANTKYLAAEISDDFKIKTVSWRPTLHDKFIGELIVKHLDRKILRLLTVSRLVERKGFIKVLNVMKKMPNLVYTVVGEGPFEVELLEAIRSRNLDDRVKILKREALDLEDIYKSHDIFIMPTSKNANEREGFGIVFLEAQYFGLPVIASDLPEMRESVASDNLFVVGENDIIESLSRLEDSDLRNKIGKSGRDFVEKNHLNSVRREEVLQYVK